MKFYSNYIKNILFEEIQKVIDSDIEMENRNVLNVLVACEESQTVCSRFREASHNAFSCDLAPCSGGRPEWHINQDVLPLINGNCTFTTSDGKKYKLVGKWDLIIAHPPCTFLTTAGNRWFNVERYGDKALKRIEDRKEAIDFFMKFANANCDHIAIENPVGVISTTWRKSDQIIQPWQFGDPAMKTTCLWLKGLPSLEHTETVKPNIEYKEWVDKKTGKKKRQDLASYNGRFLDDNDRQRTRSKTFIGIAKAMCGQWASYVMSHKTNNSELIEL